jgi:4-amino-4-deoxy-L-arabinose transferase-like glycosyltransferase
MTQHGLRLGAISAKLAPLYAYWRPHLKGWLVVPVLVLAAYFSFLRRTRIATSLADRHAATALSLFFLAITLSVSFSDGGPRAIIAPLLRTDLEYFGAVDRIPTVSQVPEFLRDYPRLASTLPMHAQVHPPGSVLFVWGACRLLGGGPWAAATGIILFSALAVPLVYRWASGLGGPGVARRATAIFVLTPSAVLFTATSMDGPFAVFLIATMTLYWESMEHRPVLLGSLAGLAAALAAFMTYSVTVALLFCGIATCLRYAMATAPRQTTIVAATCALACFLATNALLWVSTGYDPIATFLAAVENHKHIMAGARHETMTRYLHFIIANLVVFFIAVGLPCAVLWWCTIARSFGGLCSTVHCPPLSDHRIVWASAITDSSRSFMWSALLTLLVAASVPVYVLEVERVWMFLVPLIVIPVARQLFMTEFGTGRIHGTMSVAMLVAAQTLLTEILLTTYW